MKLSHLRFSRDLRRGLALIIVITTISLISILVVAIFSITRTEFKATQGFVFARSAKQLGDIGTAIVQAEISNAHNTSTAPIERRIHATQPGMVRVYSATGIFVRAHKLYSSSQMTVTGTENALFTPVHQIPQDWNSDTNKARFVDLNDPVIRPSRLPGAYALYFPIIDPRAAAPAAAADDPAPVEGFSYSKQTAQVGNNASISYQEVVTPSDVSGGAGVNQLRLPMPVEWLYVLQDGTTGTLNESNEFISSAPDSEATAQNPIIGRIAFWTDDECCKVNINTAAEPTFFAPPFFYHQRDYAWANYPPASGEYQRYPGHPATVALSAVLAPGLTLDPLKAGVNRNAIVETKEQIYELAPKIAKGGSKAGTLTFVTDEMSAARGEETTLSTISDAAAARSERLYASVDDLIFKEGPYENNLRPASLYNLPDGGGKRMFDRETIERSRFFLSAHSRAPEMTIHGLPRITMWPVADEKLGSTRRTSFDNMLALCSTLRPGTSGAAIKHSYIFRRAQAHHPTHDVTGTSSQFGSSDGLRRNSLLLDYLYAQMNGLNFPGTSSAGAPTTLFSGKYGQSNVAQLAVQFFDYIRCTNLYDGVLARENNGIDGQSPTGTALYMLNDQMEGSYFTYTNHRVSRKANDSLQNSEYRGSDLLSNRSKVFPGHGTVTPAVWAKGGTSYRGLGRMLTLSEVGFQFICTADGQNDRFAVTVDGVESGGGSAPRSDPTLARRVRRDSNSGEPLRPGKPYQKDQDHQRYYSNFPPLFPLPGESEVPGDLYGCKPNEGSSSLKHPVNHPGYDPRNWNLTLANRTPLKEDEKRIQAMILFETFCPMLGWTKMYPEFALELDKDFIAQIKVKDATGASVPLFDTTSLDLVVKSNNNLYESGQTTYSLGGHAGPSQVAGNRDARPISGSGDVRMIADPNFGLGNTAGHNGLTRYGFNSNFITVKRKDALELTFGRSELVINLYDSHRFKELSLAPIQVIRINFTAEANTTQFSLPMPALAFSMQRGNIAFHPNELQEIYSTDNEGRLQYWRALPAPHWWSLNSEGCLDRLRGQVNPAYTGSPPEPLWAQAPAPPPGGEEQNVFRQTFRGRLDTGAQHFGHEAVHGGAQGVPIIPRETVGQTTDVDLGIPWSGTDVIRTMVPAVGDYRLIAARYDVPASMWMMHPVWKKEMNNGTSALKTIHSFTSHMSGSEPGVVLEPSGLSNQLTTDQQLIAGLAYIDQADNNRNFLNRRPDLPPDAGWGRVANSFGDFDNGIANSRDGPWANKPDEGNFFMGDFTRYNQKRRYRSGYFFDPWNNSEDWRSGIYMTPNRIVTSPVMFGSLPSAVWDGSNVPASANPLQSSNLSYTEGRPWQTLLFRPYSRAHSTLSKANHPGAINPRDHYLLDMFTMPVVEPYAISEPLSTAGKINLNYQIMPFTNIRRATALHALMKGEFITTIPKNADAHRAKSFYSSSNRFTEAQRQSIWGAKGDLMWDETTSPDKKFWHRPINVGVTLGQFDQKFNMAASATIHSANYRGLFRSPSQICEMHLVPDVTHGSANGKTATASDGGENIQGVSVLTSSSTGAQMEAAMSTFWQNHSPTGDNTRERPYSNLYARVTTRSNTFRVHVRAQVIRKARSVGANKFDPTKDAIVSEYRGSSLIERFIDPTDTSVPIPDYGASSDPLNQTPLEAFYQFRTLESKRFSP
jgi:uncharacterized protein (TIGR02600 family)